MNVNSCTFIGNVGKDPEVKTMNNGDQVANLSLGCSEKWTTKNGEKREKTEWVKVVVFGKLCKVVENYIKKGSKLYVRGKLQTRSWEKDGQTKHMTEIVVQGFGGEIQMLDSRGGESKPAASITHHNSDLDDQIPF
ncbi:MAG: single-stranded DNA-binding protein [Acinetobacter sp.]|nr:single-stranded DNA-binding protein [Acinetobacter sp.]